MVVGQSSTSGRVRLQYLSVVRSSATRMRRAAVRGQRPAVLGSPSRRSRSEYVRAGVGSPTAPARATAVLAGSTAVMTVGLEDEVTKALTVDDDPIKSGPRLVGTLANVA